MYVALPFLKDKVGLPGEARTHIGRLGGGCVIPLRYGKFFVFLHLKETLLFYYI